ncbi:hypothetical protein FACS189472_00130 [Alphaproteobacteria bacterium]|nr:hypothetical protein FACS189472_00130 [Alphaproteobacteria bacterium]
MASIALAMSQQKGQQFKTSEKRVNRLLQDDDFQINDSLLGDNILIKVDFSTDTDEFLILSGQRRFWRKICAIVFFDAFLSEKKRTKRSEKNGKSIFETTIDSFELKRNCVQVNIRGYFSFG